MQCYVCDKEIAQGKVFVTNECTHTAHYSCFFKTIQARHAECRVCRKKALVETDCGTSIVVQEHVQRALKVDYDRTHRDGTVVILVNPFQRNTNTLNRLGNV